MRRVLIVRSALLPVLVLVCVGLVAVGVSAGEHARASTGAASVQPVSEVQAQSDAQALLGLLRLPAGASVSPAEPAGDGGVLARPGVGPAATPNAVDVSESWTTPGSPHEALAYITAHLPDSPTVSTHGYAGGPGTPTNGYRAFQWPADAEHPGLLVINGVALADGSTGIRADAQVVWETLRPAGEVFPAGSLMRITVGSSIPSNRPHQRPLMVISQAKIRKLTAALNALEAAQPGTLFCPSDPGISIRLAIYTRGSLRPEAVAVVDPWGCSSVHVEIAGRHEPPLQSTLPDTDEPLLNAIDRITGVRLRVTPSR